MVDEEERGFLAELVDGDAEDTIRLSPVKVNGEGEIVECGGAVGRFWKNVVRRRVRDRYVVCTSGERKQGEGSFAWGEEAVICGIMYL